MKISGVSAKAYRIPLPIPHSGHRVQLPFALVRVQTTEGITGHGVGMGMSTAYSLAHFIDRTLGPALIGECPLDNDAAWETMGRRFNRWARSGVIASAVSALDIALWDIRGKAFGQPIARVLGGARQQVPVYVTFGESEYDVEMLAAVAKELVGQGHSRLKMKVGRYEAGDAAEAAYASSWRHLIEQDAARVASVREAVGSDVDLMIDANCAFSVEAAVSLCRLLQPYSVAWFEDPVRGNDVRSLKRVKDETDIPIAAGQFHGSVREHREMALREAADVILPNVVHGGGYTDCARTASMAYALDLPIATGGGWPHHNLHLHAGLANGGPVEFHLWAPELGGTLFDSVPVWQGGWATVPDTPGLGFEPFPDEELEGFLLEE